MHHATHPSDHSSPPGSGVLYLVPTPIGNLKDITLRALETLEQVDAIICEDTRVTNRLLSHYNIKKPLHLYHDHSSNSTKETIITMLLQGKKLALVSDAGTPLLSDPGYKLSQSLIEHNIPMTSLPGPSSITTALTLSGLPTDQFLFMGFLPPKSHKRQKTLQQYQALPASLVFFDSPRRIKESLHDIATLFPNRQCALLRELTKKFEETLRGTASELIALLAERELKGEIVGVIAPSSAENTLETEEEMIRLLTESLKTMTLKDAVQHVNDVSIFHKKEIYRHALLVKNNHS